MMMVASFIFISWFLQVLLDCATAYPDGKSRALIIGGGIANFTDVQASFKGITQVWGGAILFSGAVFLVSLPQWVSGLGWGLGAITDMPLAHPPGMFLPLPLPDSLPPPHTHTRRPSERRLPVSKRPTCAFL